MFVRPVPATLPSGSPRCAGTDRRKPRFQNWLALVHFRDHAAPHCLLRLQNRSLGQWSPDFNRRQVRGCQQRPKFDIRCRRNHLGGRRLVRRRCQTVPDNAIDQKSAYRGDNESAEQDGEKSSIHA